MKAACASNPMILGVMIYNMHVISMQIGNGVNRKFGIRPMPNFPKIMA